MIFGDTSKVLEAGGVVGCCVGRRGVWASPFRYEEQCWTRDFVIAGIDILLDSGGEEIVKNHLLELARRQQPNGQIPIMFLDDMWRWLGIKIRNSLREKRMSFLLKAFLSSEGVEGLSPWTRDSEMLFVLGVLKYVERTGSTIFLLRLESSLQKAISYIETHLLRDGLICGVDWRDTRPDLDKKPVLTNNCFLYQMYRMRGDSEKAEWIKSEINRRFWTGTHYRDYPGTDDWDTLGNALAVLFNIAPTEYIPLIFEKAEDFNTSCGYVLYSVTLPPKTSEEAILMERSNHRGIIWPFINGFMILAAFKAGMRDLAQLQFAKWNTLPGFFEWYDPIDKEGHGSREQLWSAALYLRCAKALAR
ncbi:MAG: hypothetical protein HZA35_03715 [Parcubacteria group bacterium]|nr:hypothetical protein [Parcubacteria group bacterium]